MVKRVKKRKKIRRFFLALFLGFGFILIIGLCLYLYFLDFNYDEFDNKSNLEESSNSFEEKIQEEVSSISMIMVGDNLIHSSIYKDASDGNGGYDFTKMYDLIKPIVSNYDIAYYNQETILGGKELGLKDYPTFNSPQEVGDAMIDAGFNLVSLASNHTIDFGEKAVLSSRAYWNSKENVLAVGSYTSLEDRNQIRVMEKNNITYTMLNYTYGTNGIKVPTGKEYLVNVWPTDLYLNDVEKDLEYQIYKEQVKKDVEAVRAKVDLLIVAMHWGVEYTHEPTKYEKDMAEYLSSLDVDIIIGTHPHVIQPIEWIEDTLVIYSLGNFISAQHQDQNYNKMVGLMTSLEINKKVVEDNTEITIQNVDNDLVYTYYKNWRNFKVVPFSGTDIGNYLPNYRSIYEIYKAIVQKYDSNISVKPLLDL